MTTREPERPPPMTTTTNESSPTSGFKGSATPPPPVGRARALTIPPPGLDELEEGYAQRPEGAFSPEQAIDEQIADLESWALLNVRSEHRDVFRFWLLRGLVFFGSGGAAVGGGLQWTRVAIICGCLAAAAAAIDASWPTTVDRSARQRAVRDLRELQHTLKLKWDKVRLAYPNPNAPKRIAHALALLDATQAKREEISRYLGDATPGVTRALS